MAYTSRPEDLVSRLKRLERELAEIRRQTSIRSTTINGGTLRLTGSARLEVADDTAGNLIARLGALGYTREDGAPQQGTELHYDGAGVTDAGGVAFAVWDPTPGAPAGRQFVGMYDRHENVVAGADPDGWGIGRPVLPISLNRADFGGAGGVPSTTSASYGGLFEAFTHQQHRALSVRVAVMVSAGTSGRARVIVDGQPFGAEVVAAGASEVRIVAADLPEAMHGFGAMRQVVIEARRDSGAGTVYLRADAWWRYAMSNG